MDNISSMARAQADDSAYAEYVQDLVQKLSHMKAMIKTEQDTLTFRAGYNLLDERLTVLEDTFAALLLGLGIKEKKDVTTGGNVSTLEETMPGK